VSIENEYLVEKLKFLMLFAQVGSEREKEILELANKIGEFLDNKPVLDVLLSLSAVMEEAIYQFCKSLKSEEQKYAFIDAYFEAHKEAIEVSLRKRGVL